jgi:cysteine desulfurase
VSDTRVYLDHNATSPLRPAAARAMREAAARTGNPASMHLEGREARRVVEQARAAVARMVAAAPDEVVFTSGGSEAIAAAVRGVCARAPGDRPRIVVSAIEHSAVLESARLAARHGFVVVEVPCTAEGRVDVERFHTQIGDDVVLACLQWANNETGVVQPVEEVGRRCRERGVPFLVDAVQAVGKIPLDRRRACADLLALSAHKLGGPQGAGALIVRGGIGLESLIAGGAQEQRRRAGTQSVAAQAGFGAAAETAMRELGDETRRLLLLRAHIETRLAELCPEVRFHGRAGARLANTVSFGIPGVPGETLVIALDLAGFALSTGSACASGAVEPSHVLLAMGLDEEAARGAVRVSLGWSTSAAEVERFLERFPEVLDRVREGLGAGPAAGS